MTINNFYRHYLKQLQNRYCLQEASVITNWVFENKASVKREDIIKVPGKILDEKIMEVLNEALQQLLQHRPVQYVLGETFFYNLRLTLNEQVLIPRPETEELVHWIIDDYKKPGENKKLSILDVGTGSGCIAIALKKNLPVAAVTATDISKGALAIARENADNNTTAIDFTETDFLNEAEWERLPVADIIVSNPPYIPVHEKEKLDKNVTCFEPHAALFVPDHSPLLFYEKIISFAKKHLNKDGKIYVEIHEDYAEETAVIFFKQFKNVEIRKDLQGKNRMIKATHFL
jgi:release factor glutamine methyltransferase